MKIQITDSEGKTQGFDDLERFIEFLNKQFDLMKFEVIDKVKIPFSENDLEDLKRGESFNWNFNGIEMHLFNEEIDE